MKTLFATSALALGLAVSAPALAQDSASQTTTPATANTAPVTGDATGATSTTSPSADASTAQQPTASSADAGAAAGAAASNSAAQISAVIEAGFPKYDTDGSGDLSQAEFKQWVSDLKTQEMAASGQALDASQADQYASRALRVADADGNKAVTRDELTAFLGGG